MNKTIIKRITALLLAAAIVAGIWVAMPNDRDSYAGETVIATPTIQKMKFWANSFSRDENGAMTSGATKPEIAQRFVYNGVTVDWDRNTDMSQYIPVYSIIQPNGYGANYVKLRDVAALVNFNVQWSFANPNAMYIWTNNHYAEEPKLSGPATETKVGEWSTYDIYVDGVKVEGLQPVLIDDNNYFKIRDIAKMVNFGCMYNVYTEEVSVVGISEYVDEAILNAMPVSNKNFLINEWIEASPERNIIFQNVRPTYGYPSGTVAASPVTLTENDPWARENYFDKYASQELKDFLSYDPSSNSRDQIELERREVAWFNASVQLILDEEISDDPNYCLPQADAYGAGFSVRIHNVGDKSKAVKLEHIDPQALLTNMNGIKEAISVFNTDRERIAYLTELVCKKITYAGAGSQYREMKARLEAYGLGMYGSGADAEAARRELGGDYYLDWDMQEGSVCQGYASALSYLCASLGYYVTGGSGIVKGSGHGWNEIWLPDEGRWVGVDATFADDYGLLSTGSIGNEVFLEIIEDKWVCWDVDGPDDPRATVKSNSRSSFITEEILKTVYEIEPREYKINPELITVNP